jgi:hypothetical protein
MSLLEGDREMGSYPENTNLQGQVKEIDFDSPSGGVTWPKKEINLPLLQEELGQESYHQMLLSIACKALCSLPEQEHTTERFQAALKCLLWKARVIAGDEENKGYPSERNRVVQGINTKRNAIYRSVFTATFQEQTWPLFDGLMVISNALKGGVELGGILATINYYLEDKKTKKLIASSWQDESEERLF